MGKYQRNKGHSYERELCHELIDLFPEVKRHLENQFQEAQGYDLDNTKDLKIQAKIGKQVPSFFYKHLDKINAKPGEKQVLIFRSDKKKSLVCMYLDDFKGIYPKIVDK